MEITVLHDVVEPSPMMSTAVGLALGNDVDQAAEEHATEIFERTREITQSHGIEILTDVTWGSPAKVIINQADS